MKSIVKKNLRINKWKISTAYFFRLHSILILFFLFSSPAIAQDIRFKNLSVKDGLSHNTVTSFCQDKQGFIWIGTADGLNKFDGNRFIIYKNNPSDSNSISDNSILSIYEDKDGFIWIGTDKGGLNRFNPRTEIFTRFISNTNNQNSISSDGINCIIGDKKGNLWISTKMGLNKLPVEEKNKTNPHFIKYLSDKNNSNSITNNTIYSLIFDSKGFLWLSLSNGFGVDKLEFTDDNFSTFKKTSFRSNLNSDNSLTGNWVLYVFEDSKGRLWISTWSAGLSKYEPDKNKFTNYKNNPADSRSLGSNYTEMVIEDNLGNIWAATYDGGLNKYIESTQNQPEYFINYKFNSINPFSLSDNRVTALFKDRGGIIWIGTSGHGFCRFNPFSQFKNISLRTNDGADEYQPSAITETYDGSLWVGTKEGILFRFDKDWKKTDRFPLRKNEQLNPHLPFICSLFEDEENTLWITTSGKGIFYVLKNSIPSANPNFIHFEPIAGEWTEKIRDKFTFVREDIKKDLYFGTNGESGIFFLSRENKLKKNFILERACTMPFGWRFENDGTSIWVGGFANGIKKISTEKRTYILSLILKHNNPYDKQGIPSNDIFTILKSKDNSIWFGTLKSLSQVPPGSDTVKHYRYKDGLANETVYGILEDDNNNLWISTYNGLSKFDTRTKLFTNFYREDGIQANEFNQFSYYKDKKGLLYFGGINGVTIINPKINVAAIEFPELKITGLNIFSMPQENRNLINEGIIKQSFGFTNEMILPYDKNAFAIEFSALEYDSPHKIKYMYKLEGYNEEWVNLSSLSHSVNFMNLEPGEYTFLLRSTNKDGIWNSKITELKIIINPPFWNALWFRIIVLLIIGGIVVFAYEIQVNAGKKQQVALQKLVDEQTRELVERNADLESFSYSVSHDLRAPLRSIYSFSQIITEDFGHQLSGEAILYFKKITNAAGNMTDLIDGILKLTQIARSELKKGDVNISEISEIIVAEMKDDFPNKTINASIQPSIMVKGDLTLLKTVMENLISNAVKFSSNNEEINIEIGKTRAFDKTKTNSSDVIYIKDNGVGFDMRYSEKIFKVFQRLHTIGEFSGTGIGLANVQKIINRHGGVIWAESEINYGATFFFIV